MNSFRVVNFDGGLTDCNGSCDEVGLFLSVWPYRES
jgi:hypothetical protein